MDVEPRDGRVRPITPDEASGVKKESIPDAVIQTVNWLIGQNFHHDSATIKQKDLMVELVAAGFHPEEVYRRGWLDFEDIYRAQGWKVEYDKPGRDESYDAYYQFTRKK